MKILSPLYIFTNDMQSDDANISYVVPSILTLIHANLDRMVLPIAEQDEFRNNLIQYIKHKFNFELTSKVYLVAAVLNVGTLKKWANIGLNSTLAKIYKFN